MPPPARHPALAAAAFYARTLPVTAAIVLQWFAMFAVLAYSVPHVACLDELVKERVRQGMGGGLTGKKKGEGCPLAAAAGATTAPALSLFFSSVHV